MNEHFKLMVAIIINVILIACVPLLLLLCVNTLGCTIPYTLQTWAACLGLLVIRKFNDRGRE